MKDTYGVFSLSLSLSLSAIELQASANLKIIFAVI